MIMGDLLDVYDEEDLIVPDVIEETELFSKKILLIGELFSKIIKNYEEIGEEAVLHFENEATNLSEGISLAEEYGFDCSKISVVEIAQDILGEILELFTSDEIWILDNQEETTRFMILISKLLDFCDDHLEPKINSPLDLYDGTPISILIMTHMILVDLLDNIEKGVILVAKDFSGMELLEKKIPSLDQFLCTIIKTMKNDDELLRRHPHIDSNLSDTERRGYVDNVVNDLVEDNYDGFPESVVIIAKNLLGEILELVENRKLYFLGEPVEETEALKALLECAIEFCDKLAFYNTEDDPCLCPFSDDVPCEECEVMDSFGDCPFLENPLDRTVGMLELATQMLHKVQEGFVKGFLELKGSDDDKSQYRSLLNTITEMCQDEVMDRYDDFMD